MSNSLGDALNELNGLSRRKNNNQTPSVKKDEPVLQKENVATSETLSKPESIGSAIDKASQKIIRRNPNRNTNISVDEIFARQRTQSSFSGDLVSHIQENNPKPIAPVIIKQSGHKPTPEMEAIIKSDAHKLKVIAFAGAGKTSTLVEYANRRSRGNGLYIAFNKDIKKEAMSRFPSNVKCMTSHGLAYAQYGLPLIDKLDIPLRWKSVFEATNIEPPHPLIAKAYARLLLTTVFNFIASSDELINEEHIQLSELKLLMASEKSAQYLPSQRNIVIAAEVLWREMVNPYNKEIGTTHDSYLKLMQLASPQLPYDYILLDEAQDSNPALLDLITKQDCVQVLVGDPHQSIYSFRKSIDAMTSTYADAVFPLTNSFRFGPEIADFANSILALKGETNSIIGLGAPGRVYNGASILGEGKSAYISRSNSALFRELVNKSQINKKLYVAGGASGARFDLLEDLYKLKYSSERPKDALLASFHTFDEFENAVTENQEIEWVSRCKLINEMGESFIHKLQSIKNNMVSEPGKADQIFSTVHKFKGLQCEHVTLADDFHKNPASDNEYKSFAKPESHEEINILYVAATRATHTLNIRPNHKLYWDKISPMISPDLSQQERISRNNAFDIDLQKHFERIVLHKNIEQAVKKIQDPVFNSSDNTDEDPFHMGKSLEIKRKPRL